MNGTAALLAVCALLVAGVAAPAVGATTGGAGSPDRAAQVSQGNVSNGSVPPGAHLSGLVGVQRAELDGELADRSFGIRIARSNSNASRAAVVADQVADLDAEVTELRDRRRELLEARQNGTISETRFRVEMAALAARNGAVERRLDRTETTARDIPDDVLESKGVNATAIEALRNETKNLTGPEVADIARSVAGPNVGHGLASNASTGPRTDFPGQPGSAATESRNAPPSDSTGRPDGPPGRSDSSGTESSDERTPRDSGPPVDPGGDRGNASNPGQAIEFPWGSFL